MHTGSEPGHPHCHAQDFFSRLSSLTHSRYLQTLAISPANVNNWIVYFTRLLFIMKVFFGYHIRFCFLANFQDRLCWWISSLKAQTTAVFSQIIPFIPKYFIWIKLLTNSDINKVGATQWLNNTNETTRGTFKTLVNELQGRFSMGKQNKALAKLTYFFIIPLLKCNLMLKKRRAQWVAV